MSFFSDIFGGNKTVTQAASSAPWEATQPHLRRIFGEAERLYDEESPTYFPGSTVVGFSPQTEQALRMTEGQVMGGSPIRAAGEAEMMATLGGDYLEGSPFFEGAFEAQVRPTVQRYAEELLPGLQSSFTGGGTRGSSSEAAAAGRMMDSYTRALSDTGGTLAFQNYANERANQNAAMRMAPEYAMTRFAEPQMLANVGAARENLAQAQLADEVQRHNFEQNIQANKLAQYLGIVGGGFGSEGTTTMPVYRNVGASLLGGGLAGAGLADALDLGSGGTAGAAGLGALLSLF